MKKVVLLCLAFATIGVTAVAQSAGQAAPKKILTAKEVGSYIANKKAIEADLEALGDKYSEYFEDIEVESPEASNVDPAVAFADMRAMKIPAEIQAVMKKNGLGDNGYEKFLVITYGFGALYFERQIDAQLAGQTASPEMKPFIDQMKLAAAQMKAGVHSSDLALISARYDDLVAVMEAGE